MQRHIFVIEILLSSSVNDRTSSWMPYKGPWMREFCLVQMPSLYLVC